MPRSSETSRNLMKYTLLVCASLSIMCTAIMSPALPMMKKAFSGYENAEMMIKLAATIPNIFIAISCPIFGLLISKMNKRYTLLISLVFYVVAGCSVSFANNILSIIISRSILGIALSALLVLGLEMIAENFTGKERTKTISAQVTIMSVGSIIFTLLSGIICDINWRLAFLLYGTQAILIPLVFFFVKDVRSKKDLAAEEQKIVEQLAPPSPFSRIFGKKLPFLICFISFVNMAFFYMIPIELPFALKKIDPLMTSFLISIVITIEVVTSAIFAPKYKRLKKNRSFESMCAVSLGIMALSYLCLSYCRSYWTVLIFVGMYGIGMAFMMPNNIIWMITSCGSKHRAFWIGLLESGIYLGKFGSPLIAKPLIENFGIFKAYRISAVMMLFFAVLVSFFAGKYSQKTMDGHKSPHDDKDKAKYRARRRTIASAR